MKTPRPGYFGPFSLKDILPKDNMYIKYTVEWQVFVTKLPQQRKDKKTQWHIIKFLGYLFGTCTDGLNLYTGVIRLFRSLN